MGKRTDAAVEVLAEAARLDYMEEVEEILDKHLQMAPQAIELIAKEIVVKLFGAGR